MKHFLVVVDMQNDFINGPLGTNEALAAVSAAAEKIRGFSGEIFATLDTHSENYLSTAEGRHLPVIHCVKGTNGWQINPDISAALTQKGFTPVEKPAFGSMELPELIREKACGSEFTIELIGLCTDICVISNALILKACFPETEITVDARCCAGVTPESHLAAITAMKMCQINILNFTNQEGAKNDT